MGFEAMNRWSALVLDPVTLAIILAGRGNDRRISEHTGLHLDHFGVKLAGDLIEQDLVQAMGDKDLLKPDERRPLRRRL